MDIKALTHTLTIAALELRAELEAAQQEADMQEENARAINAWTVAHEQNPLTTDAEMEEVYEVNERVCSRASYARDIESQYHDVVEDLTGLLSNLGILESFKEHYNKISERA